MEISRKYFFKYFYEILKMSIRHLGIIKNFEHRILTEIL